MGKQVFKQIVTILLSIALIVLIFAIIFYRYIPTNKVLPTKVQAYKTPESIEEEIKESATEKEFESTNEVYEVTDSDLSIYQSKRSYTPGKSDPFKEYSGEGETAVTNVTGTGATAGTTSNGTTKASDNKNVTDNYYKASGVGTGSK